MALPWIYSPKIELIRNMRILAKTTDLMPALEHTLQRCQEQTLSVQDFCLESPKLDLDLLEKWIPFLLLGAKKFRISSFTYFVMPSVIFQSESLQELNLYRCGLSKITSTDKVMFKNLQTLSLTVVSIDDETLEKIMSSCPLIQSLVIHNCKGLRAVKVSNAHNLKAFSFEEQTDSCSIEIDVPSSLETIHIGRCTKWFLYNNNNNMYFNHLKSLHLSYKTLSAKSFTFFSCNFPVLKSWSFVIAGSPKGFQLSIPSIKRLNLDMSSDSSITAAIDAPNIQCFRFFGLPRITFTTITSSNEWESRIVVPGCVYRDATWLQKLNNLLKALSQSRISLEMEYFPKDYWRIEYTDCGGGKEEPVVVEHLSLVGNYFAYQFPGVFNCLLHTCRPRYIGMKFLSEDNVRQQRRRRIRDNRLAEIIKGEMSQCYLWKQDLDELSIQVSDENGKEWYPVQGTGFLEYAVSNEQEILLRSKFSMYSPHSFLMPLCC